MPPSKGTFVFPDSEINRYKAHGLAHAAIYTMAVVPMWVCEIDVAPLAAISEPRYAWISRQFEQAPEVMVASRDFKPVPGDAVALDPGKELSAVLVYMWHKGPPRSEIEPVYADGQT